MERTWLSAVIKVPFACDVSMAVFKAELSAFNCGITFHKYQSRPPEILGVKYGHQGSSAPSQTPRILSPWCKCALERVIETRILAVLTTEYIK